jgi:hypothetical protein
MWNLVLVHLEIVLILSQDRFMVCGESTIGSKIILDAPGGSPRCIGPMESRFGPFGDSVSVGARQEHGLRQMHHRLRNHFGPTRWYSLVTRPN